MFVNPLSAALPSAPVNKASKTAKVGKRAALAKVDDGTVDASTGGDRELARIPLVKRRAPDARNAPKSAMAMSSNAVLEALMQLKPGG